MKNPTLSIQVMRGSLVESEHLVDAVVIKKDGSIRAVYGDGDTLTTYPRSSIKMLQSVSFVESGAFDQFELSPAHLALASSSHYGETLHTDMVRAWLKQIGCQESELVCGAHYPGDEKAKFDLIQSGKSPEKSHNNCSGKHTAFLSTLKVLGVRAQGYQKYDHPLQSRLRDILSELCDENIHRAAWGIDGCGIPTYAMKLISVARGMGKFLSGDELSQPRAQAMKKILQAVQLEPAYFSGTHGFAHDLMKVTESQVVVKSGAEGIYAGLSLSQEFSFALKVRDGNQRAAVVSSLWLLNQFGALSEEQKVRLSEHSEPTIKNWSGEVVGKIIVASP